MKHDSHDKPFGELQKGKVATAIDIAQTRHKEEIFYNEGGEIQIALRGGRCPIPGNIQGQVGRDTEQPDLIEGCPYSLQGSWTR